MAEFIFDIQRFDDGDGGDTGSDTSTESGTAGTGGASGTSIGSGGHGLSGGYTYSQWNAIADNAQSNFDAAVELGTYNFYVGTYGVADNFLVSRYAINIIENVDQFDTITFTDANSWDFVAYSSGNDYDINNNVTGRYLGVFLNLTSDKDSGAGSLTTIHYSDAYASGSDYFSPTIAFANESILYSNNTGWTTPEQVAFADYFWSTCLTQSGTYGVPEVLAASRGVNNYITNVDENDIILFADAKLFDDLHSADYVGGGVAFTFNNGTTTFVEYGGTFSPTIQLASGESFVYNSRLNEWRTPAQAAADSAIYAAEELTNTYLYGGNDYSVDTFSVTRLTDTYIYDTQYLDNIVFTDGTTAANITSYEAEGDYLTLTFDTG